MPWLPELFSAPVLQDVLDKRRLERVVAVPYYEGFLTGEPDAMVESFTGATFEPDGYVRETTGADHVHRGHGSLRAFYDQLLSNGGGIAHEHCTILGDERTCALEYNLVRWGAAQLLPQAGIASYVKGPSGKLAALRIYDDVEPPAAG